MQCPICHSSQTGKVGANQYYCWNCFVEFTTSGEGEIYEISEDGSLLAVNQELS
jgi:hypothetical protein